MTFRPTRLDAPAATPSPHLAAQPSPLLLRLERGCAAQRSRVITPPVFLIGGADDCDLVLAAPEFPDAYAYIYTGPRVTIRWLGEGPLLHVAGREVEQAVLRDGALIEFGPFSLRFVVEPSQPDDPDGLPADPAQRPAENALGSWHVAEERAKAEVRAFLSAVRVALAAERTISPVAQSSPVAQPEYPAILPYQPRLRSA